MCSGAETGASQPRCPALKRSCTHKSIQQLHARRCPSAAPISRRCPSVRLPPSPCSTVPQPPLIGPVTAWGSVQPSLCRQGDGGSRRVQEGEGPAASVALPPPSSCRLRRPAASVALLPPSSCRLRHPAGRARSPCRLIRERERRESHLMRARERGEREERERRLIRAPPSAPLYISVCSASIGHPAAYLRLGPRPPPHALKRRWGHGGQRMQRRV